MLTHPLVIIVASGTLVGIFLRGAWHKFFDFTWFAHTLSEYRILPAGFAVPAAGFLLAAEVAVTLGLVVPESRFYAAAGAAVLLVLYG
ncbi:MauE/DoxX family redox-associated membrane protein, partial [Rhizobiaceae sp. 2RAB30]